MALKHREKLLVGVMLIGLSLYLLIVVGLGQFNQLTTNLKTIDESKEKTELLISQKAKLQAEVVELKNLSLLPPGIKIMTYANQNQEVRVKELLDTVVNMATENNNKLVRLTPTSVPPLVQPVAPSTNKKKNKKKGKEEPEAPKPVINAHVAGYEIAIRGTYASIDAFLQAMDKYEYVVEFFDTAILNEAGPIRDLSFKRKRGNKRSKSVDVKDFVGEKEFYDASKPVILNAKLRLLLERANTK